MRIVRHTSWILLALALGCGSGKTVPESGAVLLAVQNPAGELIPDELRAWVYDDSGLLWDGVRIPEQGPLAVANAQNLGTILVAPGPIQGKLRIHLRGYVGGVRILDGLLIIDLMAGGDRTFDLLLDAALPLDEDGDDVPDSIDDCLGVANPAQGGCPLVVPDAAVADGPGDTTQPSPEAGVDSSRDTEAPDGGAELPPDVSLPSPEAGAEIPRDALAGLDEGTEVPRDAVPVGPDGVEAGADGDASLDSVRDSVRREAGDTASAERPDVGPAIDAVDAGADGVEADVPRDTASDTADDGSEPGDDGGCGDACGKPQGASCETNEECASGACADGVCCTNSCLGVCRSCNQPTANGTCQGYAVGSDPEGECQDGNKCNGVGACGPPPSNLPNGQLCTSPSQCQSGFCADGVCCNSDCTTPCMACGTGTCVVVTGTQDIPECSGTATCNPKGKCVAN